MKILISAYACEPDRGSEPGAGWAWTLAAAREHDVWLLTHGTNKAVVEAALAADPGLAGRVRPVFLRNCRLLQPLRRKGATRFLYYVLWQLTVCRTVARQLHDDIRFDVAHHVTYASDWMPSGISALPGVPFVWGPVGGASTRSPVRLWRHLGWRTAASELLRGMFLGSCRRLVGVPTAGRAAVMLGQNSDVATAFAPVAVEVEPNVALDPGEFNRPRQPNGGPPRAMYAGRLLGWKGVRLSLDALRRPEAAGWTLELYGDGPLRPRLERLADRWGLADRVTFHGDRPRSEVRDALTRADVLLFSTVHDAAGWTVAEALASGCPVVALRVGGPASLVGPGDGTLVDVTGDVPGALAQALTQARTATPRRDAYGADRIPDVLQRAYVRARAFPAESEISAR